MTPRLLTGLGLGALAGVVLLLPSHTPRAPGWRARPVGRHFRLGEFVTWATSRGPHRAPPPAVEAQIRRLVADILDPLREALGRPINVASGWRPVDLFPLPPGRTSGHTIGAAADVYVAGLQPGELARHVDALASRGAVAQGGVGVYPPGLAMADGTTRTAWDPTVHVDTGAHTTPGRRRWPLTWWRTAA